MPSFPPPPLTVNVPFVTFAVAADVIVTFAPFGPTELVVMVSSNHSTDASES